jgi:hypothetical protein
MTLQGDLSVDPDEAVMDAARFPDTLVSLMHLVYWNDGEAGLVQLYARQLEDRLRGVEALLRSSDPNVREARARLCN